MKHYFLYRLKPPRATFAQDMTLKEAEIMARHVEYWTGLLEKGVAVAFGPVADPAGSWGIAIVEADSIDEVRDLRIDDPAVSSGMATADVFPMPKAIARRRQ